MSFDLFIVFTKQHPALVDLGEHFAAVLNGKEKLQTLRDELEQNRLALSDPAAHSDCVNLHLTRVYEVSYLRMNLVCSQLENSVTALESAIYKAKLNLNIGFAVWPARERAIVKNNLLCAEALTAVMKHTFQSLKSELEEFHQDVEEFRGINSLHDASCCDESRKGYLFGR